MNKNKYLYLYIIIMIIIGIIQIIDWYYGSEDPIWHLLFYIYIIPIISFGFGIMDSQLLTPFISFVMTFLIYIIFGNGGLNFDLDGLKLCILPFITTLIGVGIRKLQIKYKL